MRVLAVVGSDYWEGRKIDPGWPGYEVTFDDLFVDATARGLRLQVVLFGDVTEFLTTQAERRAWVRQMAAYLERHRSAVMFVEIANESTGIGLSAPDLAELSALWEQLSSIPYAASAVYDTDDDVQRASGFSGIEKFFGTFPGLEPDLLTPHFDRDLREEGYRPSRQPWEVQFYENVPAFAFVNNEPIGPGSSVEIQTDPSTLAMDMANTFMSRGAGYTLHSNAGVRGDINFWEVTNVEPILTALRFIHTLLPANIANGENQNHHWPGHPYVDLDQIWTSNSSGQGVVRAFFSEIDGVGYAPVMGMKGQYDIEAKWAIGVEVFDVCTQQRIEVVELTQGEHHTFQVTPCRDFVHRIVRR